MFSFPQDIGRHIMGRAGRLFLTVSGLLALTYFAWGHRRDIGAMLLQTDMKVLACSVFMALLANALTGFAFRVFCAQHDLKVSAVQACYMQILVQVTKYVPGSVWGAFAQSQLIGSSRVAAIFIAGISSSAFLMMTMSASGISALLMRNDMGRGVALILAGWLAAAFIGASAWLPRILAYFARLFGRSMTLGQSHRRSNDLLPLFAAGACHSVALGCSVALLLVSTSQFTGTEIYLGIASVMLAWVAGSLAIFVPSGLGVREIAFVALATSFGINASSERLAAMAIVMRVAQTLPDLLAALIVGAVELAGSYRRRATVRISSER